MRLHQRPYNLLLLTATLLFVSGLFTLNFAIDIHLYDTYYIVSMAHFIWSPIPILFIFWVLYLATKNILFSKQLMWTHIIITIGTCVFWLTFSFFLKRENVAGIPGRYYDTAQSGTYSFYESVTQGIVIAALIFTLGQLLYFANFFIGLYRRMRPPTHR